MRFSRRQDLQHGRSSADRVLPIIQAHLHPCNARLSPKTGTVGHRSRRPSRPVGAPLRSQTRRAIAEEATGTGADHAAVPLFGTRQEMPIP
ncbi:MAG: hypothetical protein OZSIB_3067 [Candidatus Ozemobacter sibiricus]|uniref:Uncharacterized protein n=1 Tax=Candidatus Ozemobacter sibiricus TaxID=2268124 RepID=A0A367ZGQ6_9BACT|nr:MAG: hypothetical protein OZSIB_3067 [Candidatus Ozemobacter sibiricus]